MKKKKKKKKKKKSYCSHLRSDREIAVILVHYYFRYDRILVSIVRIPLADNAQFVMCFDGLLS